MLQFLRRVLGITALEERLVEVEQQLNPRLWDVPPSNVIDMVDLPTFPDYTTGYTVGEDGDEWRPAGYL